MHIFITGGTGFIGRALIKQWHIQGYQITLLTRSISKTSQLFPASNQLSFIEKLPDSLSADIVINLAGEPIFNRAWSPKQKNILWQSRIEITEKLTALINQSENPPHCFISASASGYYGDKADQLITENDNAGSDFTSKLCLAWEDRALQANTRVFLLRTGLVLNPEGGLLGKILPLYRYGLGGKLGSGQQFMPWIALTDMLKAINFLIHNSSSEGAFNLSAPNPVRNTEFNKLLAKQLKRPYFSTVPSFLLKLILGERTNLLLNSQNMYPQKLIEQGFHFQYCQLEDYLQATFGNRNNTV